MKSKALPFLLIYPLLLLSYIQLYLQTASSQIQTNEGIEITKKREFQKFFEISFVGNRTSSRKSNRQGRCFLPLLVVKIKDDACNATRTNLVGTCLTRKQCISNKGSIDGVCAKGYGTCCSFQISCGGRVLHNNTYFQSRNFPSGFQPNGVETCSVDIPKRSKNICQVRLDFLSTNIEGGNNNGVCQIDRIQFYGIPDGAGTIPLNLCGPMDGQSVYLDYGYSNQISLSFITDGNLSNKLRSWNVRVSYIECNSPSIAPNGCFQYFTRIMGQVKILGYPQSPHLANLTYAVCVRAEEGARAISWSRCPKEPVDQSFWFTGGPFSSGAQAVSSCNGDYVVIMSTLGNPSRINDRYCGNTLSTISPATPVTSAEKPFILRVKTDDIEGEIERGNTGFCLRWLQEF